MVHLARRSCYAFTLIELLVVVAIAGLLVSLVLAALGSARNRSQTLKCSTQQRSIVHSMSSYALSHSNRLPHAPSENRSLPSKWAASRQSPLAGFSFTQADEDGLHTIPSNFAGSALSGDADKFRNATLWSSFWLLLAEEQGLMGKAALADVYLCPSDRTRINQTQELRANIESIAADGDVFDDGRKYLTPTSYRYVLSAMLSPLLLQLTDQGESVTGDDPISLNYWRANGNHEKYVRYNRIDMIRFPANKVLFFQYHDTHSASHESTNHKLWFYPDVVLPAAFADGSVRLINTYQDALTGSKDDTSAYANPPAGAYARATRNDTGTTMWAPFILTVDGVEGRDL